MTRRNKFNVAVDSVRQCELYGGACETWLPFVGAEARNPFRSPFKLF